MVTEIEASDKNKTISHEVKADSKVNEDYLVKCIGEFGAWQARVCLLAIVSRFMVMWNMLGYIFLNYETEFICISFNGSAPVNVMPLTCYDECIEYSFSEELFVRSFVSEFELICDRAWMANIAQSIVMFGMLFGVSLFGWISDRFGRRKAFLLAAFINVTLMVGSPFAPSYWLFVCLRFFIGVASGGVLVVGIVMVLEVVGPQYRELAGCCVCLPDGFAQASLVAFAYFSPTWRVYLLAMSAAATFILAFMVLLPESPRWLMAKGRLDEVRTLLAQAAKCNNLDPVATEGNITGILMVASPNVIKKATFFDLFKTRTLTSRTLSSVFIWAVTGMCYLGINQYATFFGSNIFVVVTILGLIQVPTCFIATWLNKIFGRKISTISTLIITGIAMFLLLFAPSGHWSTLVLCIVGISSSSVTFNVIYVYVSELFPTLFRNMAYGLSTGGSKVGAMVSPFVATLSPDWMPSVIFAVLSLTAAGICVILPETKGQKLEDNIEQ